MYATSEAALKAEIERLTGAINKHKSRGTAQPFPRGNAYVNPSYRPPVRPSPPVASTSNKQPNMNAHEPREVLLDGVAFQSSSRSLVRKDLVASKPVTTLKPVRQKPYQVPSAHPYPPHNPVRRSFRPKPTSRFPRNQNMTLVNGRKPVRMGRKAVKSMKYSNKQCSRFSTTGICQRGLTCPYQHDPAKVAICWPFLQGSCPNTVESCSLSHDPTPQRTPLCVHFANNARCKNGASCLFPHVHVGPRTGVCRDFAVLGYCEKGIDCDKQHVKECPDFAEKGACPNPKCKLPHVIRANHRRTTALKDTAMKTPTPEADMNSLATDMNPIEPQAVQDLNEAKIGDEFISLTFHESDESEVEEDEEMSTEEYESVGDGDEDNSPMDNLEVVG